MIFYVYGLFLLISIGVLVYLTCRNYNNIDTYFWSIVMLIPIILLGYTMKTRAVNAEEAKLAFCFIYLDSTLLPVLAIFTMLRTLGIKIKGWFKLALYILCFSHLLMVWLCKDNALYYASMTVEKTPLGSITKMTSGPLKGLHYGYLVLMFALIIGILVLCFVKKKDCSIRSLLTYSIIGVVCIIFYAIEMTADFDFSLLPVLYVISDVFIALAYDRTHCHDMDFVVVDHKNDDTTRGYIAFDIKGRLLGYSENALLFIPELRGKRIDARFDDNDTRLQEICYPLIDTYERDKKATADYSVDQLIFRCIVTYFYMHKGGRPSGYLFEIQDVTAEQGYLNLIKEYSQSLQKEVEAQTEHIRNIQQQVTLGMATIIENRDMNTGGHVRRTSAIIKILVEEMRNQGFQELDDVYADEIIRSAPMHDLGKISIDNAILCKPAKLTDEEFAIMKTHSAKSGEIVQAILAGVESPHFVVTAYQLARFHHERWDGRGYPERLVEDEIPLEARIMAVADVYDALVSKRCYKEPMSYEMAAKIMMEGMGSQFDPMMGPVFMGCREKLEAYYKAQQEAC